MSEHKDQENSRLQGAVRRALWSRIGICIRGKSDIKHSAGEAGMGGMQCLR